MSVCGQTEEESGSEEPPGGAAVRDMYEQKAVSKVVRVLTVLAYLLSVSLAAILLSVYYVCVWQSPKLPALNDTAANKLQADPPHNYTDNTTHIPHPTNDTGGGDSTVSEAVTSPSPDLTSLPADYQPSDKPPPFDASNTTTYDFSNATATPNVTLNDTDQR